MEVGQKVPPPVLGAWGAPTTAAVIARSSLVSPLIEMVSGPAGPRELGVRGSGRSPTAPPTETHTLMVL